MYVHTCRMNTKTTTTRITISLPTAMVKAAEEQGRLELRNRSELVREALRQYLKRNPTSEATRSEVSALERGRKEIARGEYVTLNQLRHGMNGRRPRARELGDGVDVAGETICNS